MKLFYAEWREKYKDGKPKCTDWFEGYVFAETKEKVLDVISEFDDTDYFLEECYEVNSKEERVLITKQDWTC